MVKNPSRNFAVNFAYFAFNKIENQPLYSISPLTFNFLTNFISCSTIIRISSLKEVLVGFQPNSVRALVGSPSNCSTSAGRKYFGSISTSTFPVAASMPFSSTPVPSHLISIPACAKASVQNSRTVCISPVAITKSSGTGCCRIIHIHST